MRVLFVTFPYKTHFLMDVTMAWALHTAGHEVHVASGPELVEDITGAGLTAVPVGSAETLQEKTVRATEDGSLMTPQKWLEMGSPSVDMAEDREEELTWEQLKFLYGTVHVPKAKIWNDSMFDDLVDYCRWWRPDLVVWEALSYAGAVAATATGAAHARMPFAIDVYSRMRGHYLRVKDQQPPEAREDALAEWLGEWAAKYGCEFSEEMVTGQFTIDQMLDSMRLPSELHHVPIRHVPYNGPSVVPKWLVGDPPAPRVLMTFGLMMKDAPILQVISTEQLQETLNAVADLDIELVVTLPDKLRDELDNIPKNTKIVDFVPLHAIIPSCSVVIHHGGIPGFCGSLTYGVPQLQISLAPDAAIRGEHLREAQAGLWISPGEVSAAKVRDALVRLLEDPSFREGAMRLRQELLSRPSPNEAVPELERLTAKYRAERPE